MAPVMVGMARICRGLCARAAHGLRANIESHGPGIVGSRFNEFDDIQIIVRLIRQLTNGELGCLVFLLFGNKSVNVCALHVSNVPKPSDAGQFLGQIARCYVSPELSALHRLAGREQGSCATESGHRQAKPHVDFTYRAGT
jgi:hypothetical protein